MSKARITQDNKTEWSFVYNNKDRQLVIEEKISQLSIRLDGLYLAYFEKIKNTDDCVTYKVSSNTATTLALSIDPTKGYFLNLGYHTYWAISKDFGELLKEWFKEQLKNQEKLINDHYFNYE